MTIEEFFGDGSGNPIALPVEETWYSGQPLDVRVADPCDLICRANVSVLLADNVEVRAQMRDRQGGAGDWLVIPMPLNFGSYVEWTDMIARVPGALAQNSPFMLHVPGPYGGPQSSEPGHDIRLQARRIGGGATTEFYADGERRYNRDSPSMLSQLAEAGGVASLISDVSDPVTGTVLTSEQAGPETVLDGETLFSITGGAIGTYDYYVEHDEFRSFVLHYIPGGAGTATLKIRASAQDDGTPIASREYEDVTGSTFGSASFNSRQWLADHAGLLRDAKSLHFEVVVTVDVADFTGYFKQSY